MTLNRIPISTGHLRASEIKKKKNACRERHIPDEDVTNPGFTFCVNHQRFENVGIALDQ